MSFKNEPLLELRRESERDRLTQALQSLDRTLPIAVPVIVNGDRRDRPSLHSCDPGEPERTVAQATVATAAEVDAAVVAADGCLLTWGRTLAGERAAALRRAAGELRSRRHTLAALAVRECAKPWIEADADVCEAIDFLEYYAREAVRLESASELTQLPGERNELYYRPRGVVAVIAPWNFPIAIAAGMTAAALASGNAVCLKPAEQSPACAHALVEALHKGGVPAAALSLLPGEGEVGAALVEHPGVHTIAFTGSGAVGLQILRKAAELAQGQRHLKRVVAEMGGKNCVIVDADADLDEVVPALISSAFGFAGQKCSAASRVLAHERIAEVLTQRMTGAMRTLLVDQAQRFGVDVPPLIEAAAQQRVESYVQGAKVDGANVVRVEEVPKHGFFAAPALITEVRSEMPVVQEEIFGPVLTIERVREVEQACEIVNAQAHALTGGLFTRNPRTIEAVVKRTPVGNLYVNRAITGAMVSRQPFGGNRLSGNGTKAGGPDYLLHFVEPVVVTENTVRHGLAL
ncbi:MAG TPA: aldehyde dehydrogenase family protein [Solirubrobacteraceae bacterium]|jgi:RHH-type proline utilization regulon transcriptional repressor/proline dehydrogenase/delta 1-pyrroline-5-carboxylate dehydrogenase|nr:aldehyde dehydrogenase family protein [Solirubrobacteraceae bacterium]